MKRQFIYRLLIAAVVVTGCGGASSAVKTSTETTATAALSAIQMLSDTAGWAMGGQNRSILRTDDGGLHWQDVTPAEVKDHKDRSLAAEFMAPQAAWLAAWKMEEGTVAIYRTADGGRTWGQSQLSSGYPFVSGVQMSFVTDKHGWALTTPEQTMNGSAGNLFETTDAGETWAKVSSTGDGTGGTLPVSGRIRFRADATGWLVGSQQSTGAKSLYATKDGGRTWLPQVLDLPAGAGAGSLWLEEPPLLVGPNRQTPMLSVRLWPESGQATAFATYIYQPGGASGHWQSTKPVQFTGVAAFISARDGWVWAPEPRDTGSTAPVRGHLYRTGDSGAAWAPTDLDPTLSAILQKGHDIAALQFVNEQIGWALLCSASCKESELLRTQNGGKRWAQVYPPN